MLSESIRQLVLQKRKNGLSYQEISKDLLLPRASVQSICRRCNLTKKKAGRKAKISAREGRYIKKCLQNYFNNDEKITSRKVINSANINVSRRTMQRHLKRDGYKYGNIKKRIILTAKQKEKRKEICKQWLKEKLNFNEIVMSDEKFFRLDGPDNWFSYSSNDRKLPKRNLRQQGGGGLMVHCVALSNGTFLLNYLTRCFNSKDYVTLLEENVMPFVKKHLKDHFIWQHDGASIHKSKITTAHLTEREIKILPWPAKSPDLNVVEKIWAWLVEDLYLTGKISNLRELRDKIDSCVTRMKKSISESIQLFYEKYFDKVMEVITKDGSF